MLRRLPIPARLRQWYADLAITPRILMLATPPLVATLILSQVLLVSLSQQSNGLNQIARMSRLVHGVTDVIDALQQERDDSAALLAGTDRDRQVLLEAKRRITNGAMNAFLTENRPDIAPPGSPIARKIDLLRTQLSAVIGQRPQIDTRTATQDDSAQRFTAAISGLIDIIPEAGVSAQHASQSEGGSRTFLMLFDFVQAKERASQERALGYRGFAAGGFAPALWRDFSEAHDEQASFLRIFMASASPGQQRILREASFDPSYPRVESLEHAVMENAPGKILGTELAASWFTASTARLDTLRDVELTLIRELESVSEADRDNAQSWFYVMLPSMALCALLIALVTTTTGHNISRSIRRMTRAMTDLAGGDHDVEIPERDRANEIGAMAAAVGIFRTNAIARQQTEAQIIYMARHDSLTGLLNRGAMHEAAQSTVANATRLRNAAMLCLDLDRFKAVNDTFGHLIGDELLCAVARRLGDCLGEGDLLGRMGGDEFAILQAGGRQPDRATKLARAIVQAIDTPFEIGGHQLSIGASIGIAVAPLHGTDPNHIMRNADIAMYQAKGAGGSSFRMFETDMDTELQARRDIETDMREALERDEFELHYQPILDARSGRILSFEALLRWTHPVRGRVPPSAFIPVAEQTGLIANLAEWAVDRACRDAVKWPAGIAVAVNISPMQFQNHRIATVIREALTRSGLSATRLEIEVTESVLLRESDETLSVLHKLRNMGVRISLDDFGTGYSSLSYLRSFPFSKLKIDQSFVRGPGANKETAAIIRTIAALGRSLHMTVTAEGVETEDQLKRVQAEGCDEVQGFLFSCPLPLAEIGPLLARNLAGQQPGGMKRAALQHTGR